MKEIHSNNQHVSTKANFNKRYAYFYCINAAMLALGLFLHGFFPFKSVRGSFSSVSDLPLQLGNHRFYTEEIYKPRVEKLVIMMIDAIRYDFVRGEDGETNMPYTLSSIKENKACLFKLKAGAPTVTMPRIKAITSGFVSNFIDVLMNFGSSEMLDDNIIDQAKDNKYKIIFYGDDTWLNLFPERFSRSEGTKSFFVSDYTQVDLNVTRNVNIELEKDDWDIMILHYLGLDHIGHFDGPKSKLVKPKLNEMDDIVVQLHSYLLKQENYGNKSTLLMVMGDHGMADFGGHGGTSIPEIIIPLITFGLGCGGIHEPEISQVDVASTLSVLLGVPIPADNVGHVILRLLTSATSYSTYDILYIMYYNAFQVVTRFLQNGGTVLHEGYKKYWDAQTKHTEWLKKLDEEALNTNSGKSSSENLAREIIRNYEYALQLMSSELLKSNADFHLIEMIIAIIILTQLFLIAFFGETLEVPSSIRLHIVSATVFSLTFMCWWMNLLDISCCFSSLSSTTVSLILIFVITINSILISNCRLSNIFSHITEIKPDNFICYLLLVGTILQNWSLTSTSFIEKEEEVWYHLFMFILIATMIFDISKEYGCASLQPVPLNNLLNENQRSILKWCLLLLIHRFLKNYQMCQYNLTVYWLSTQNIKIYFSIILCAGLIGIWWSLTEISNRLRLKKNNFIAVCEKCCIAGCLLMVYYYRAVTGKLILPFGIGSISSYQGVFEVKIFFLFLILLFIVKVYNMKKYSAVFNRKKSNLFPQYLLASMVEVVLICWILLCTLLAKPYNVWLFCALFLSCEFFSERFKNNIVHITSIYYWIGMLFYFYQGNRNIISSIDITPGYVGQSDYNAVIAGLLIGINTFSFPVTAYLLLFLKILKGDWKLNMIIVYKVRSLILLMHLIIYLFFTTTHRYHLFNWSVWSPKLLYVTANSISVVILFWVTEALLVIGGNNICKQMSSSCTTI